MPAAMLPFNPVADKNAPLVRGAWMVAASVIAFQRPMKSAISRFN